MTGDAGAMNEASAREVTLLQAFETVQPASPSWSEDDRAWASRLALQTDGASADAEAFLAQRAQHAMQRLATREPAAAKWMARRLWRWQWVVWLALAAFVLGVLADSIGSSQRINLLAPPLWAVLAWNLIVYVVLLARGLARLFMRDTRPGVLLRLTEHATRIWRGLPSGPPVSGSAPALQRFASTWLHRSAPVSGARAATLLHVGAATLALGLIAAMYLRGLVLDYRAAWESTFLSAATAHALLGAALAPAVALSGIALPDVAAFDTLRVAHGAASTVSAAPWIHLLALTLLLVVVVPRGSLALWSAARAHWLSGHVALPLSDAYYQRLLRLQQGDVGRVYVAPYASTPGAQVLPALRALLSPTLGDALQIEIAPTLAFGGEDDPGRVPVPPPGTTLAVALFDLSATPEAENQGHFARALAAGAPAGASAIMLIDEAAFARRFQADPTRLAQRREAWRLLAQACGTLPVFTDFSAPDAAVIAQDLQLAMRSPLSAQV